MIMIEQERAQQTPLCIVLKIRIKQRYATMCEFHEWLEIII